MGKGGKKRAEPQKEERFTPLERHTRRGKRFVPPVLELPQLVLSSWTNERLPEYLWLALILAASPREQALQQIRLILAGFRRENENAANVNYDLTHSGFAGWDPSLRADFFKRLAPHSVTLRPLLLLQDLPARSNWLEVISENPTEQDWTRLACAVAVILNHQSQEATDCRWARVIFKGITGGMSFPSSMEERILEIMEYPNRGDQRSVRPFIRATEGSLDALVGSSPSWPTAFWEQCSHDTACISLPEQSVDVAEKSVSEIQIDDLVGRIHSHWFETRTTTAVDARHDGAFGFALYATALLRELTVASVSTCVAGRLITRTLLETAITFAYLVKTDSTTAWEEFRGHGAGQAKLALLHLERLGAPALVTVEQLEALANEDMWLEHLPVDLGHWAASNLRELALEAQLKELYDRYYPWTSSYAHSQWGAIRSVTMSTCLNPLHRLHRVPRTIARGLPDVFPDTVHLVDAILESLDKAYPGFTFRLLRN